MTDDERCGVARHVRRLIRGGMVHKTIFVLFSALALPGAAAGQDNWQPTRGVTFHVGANVTTIDAPRLGRAGGAFFVPAVGPFELYSAVELIPADGAWQGLIAIRARPFSQHEWRVNWFVGGGWVLRRAEVRKAVISGFEMQVAGRRPFAELRFHGPIEHADGQVEFVVGIEFLLPRS